MKKRILALLMVILLMVASTACAKPESNGTENEYSDVTIRLAQQYGMQYAPVYVMQKLGLLEELLPGAKLEWNNFGGGSAMNEALISNQLDVAFMGIPPVLIAIDKGVDYRIASGICVPPAEIIVRPDSGIASLADIKPEHKIAVPGIGSIQHIMLSMAAKDILGNANAFDNNLITMANPDAYTALISGTDITGHFASMPYIDLEINDGMKSILSVEDAGGGASIVCVTTKAFAGNSKVYDALIAALNQAIKLINEQDEAAIEVIAETEKITAEAAKKYLDWPGTIYTTDLYKVAELADFMHEAGYIKNEYKGFSNVTWEGAKEASN